MRAGRGRRVPSSGKYQYHYGYTAVLIVFFWWVIRKTNLIGNDQFWVLLELKSKYIDYNFVC